MKLFILILLTAFLFNPCIAQTMDDIASLNETGLPTQTKITPVARKQVQLFARAIKGKQIAWDFEKGFSKAKPYTIPVQIKVIPIAQGQTQFLLQSMRDVQTAFEVENDYSESKINPGNGGGGALYRDGFKGIQEGMLEKQFPQAMGFIKYSHKLQGIEVDTYDSQLIYWKAMMPDNEHIQKVWEATYEDSNATPLQLQAMKTGIFRSSSFFPNEAIYFANGSVQVRLGDNTWSYYGAKVEAIIQEIIESNKDGSIDGLYETNDPSLNGIMYVVGPGNGGGGTYMIHKK